MSLVNRNPMKFLVPVSLQDVLKPGLNQRKIVPFYISPQSFDISETKIIKEELTKGGYIVQYWGEELPTITVNGTTGSGGIEAIHVLHSVYRNEIIQFQKILLDRTIEYNNSINEQLNNNTLTAATAGVINGIVNVVDLIGDGLATNIVSGTKSIVDVLKDSLNGTQDQVTQSALTPSLAVFAVSIDIYFQGEKYRGFFQNFSVNERAESPGLFDYSFNFKVLKRTGKRKNFMPWHRKSLDSSNEPKTISLPKDSQWENELSVGYGVRRIAGSRNILTSFQEDQVGKIDGKLISVSRKESIK